MSLYHYHCISVCHFFLLSLCLTQGVQSTEKFPAFDFVIGMYSTTTKEEEKDLLFSL